MKIKGQHMKVNQSTKYCKKYFSDTLPQLAVIQIVTKLIYFNVICIYLNTELSNIADCEDQN